MDKKVITIGDLQGLCDAFRERLEKVKNENPPEGFTWYGYDILSNVPLIAELLKDKKEDLFTELVGKHVADIGAADGHLSFFLESLGIKTHIVDNGPTNWNGLRGSRALKILLNSNVEIYEVDLDSQFRLPFEKYELILFLGILYHLKNPYYALEYLSKVTRYLIVSTRIANCARKNGINYSNEPMAYLLDAAESNNDSTNYWIFSEAGLNRLVQRTGWRVVSYKSVGVQEISTPQDNDLDQRAFMLLESVALT